MANHNPVGWFEILVEDFERAKNFYEQLFGWEFFLSQSASSVYWNIKTGSEGIGGGFNKKESKSSGGCQAVILYIDTENIEEILDNVQKLGGHVIKHKTLISESAGYYGLFRDLDNNVMGLWSKK